MKVRLNVAVVILGRVCECVFFFFFLAFEREGDVSQRERNACQGEPEGILNKSSGQYGWSSSDGEGLVCWLAVPR